MFIGIDIGTSGTKVALLDGDGGLVATASRHYPVERPHPLWSEQDPEHWIEAAFSAMDELAARHPTEMAMVAGIGFSGQMHGATLIDADGKVLRPCILWNDGRAFAECAELTASLPDLHAITGNLAMPGFTAPKLLWVKKHEPEIFARIAMVLLPKAYVRLRFSGEAVEDMSDASGTLWLDVGARDWSDKALAATGLARTQMPRLVEGSAVSAMLLPELARRWGMARPPVLAGGAGDCAAGAIGVGAIHPGDCYLSLGTSGVLWATTDRFLPNPASAVHAFCHAIPGTWHQMGVMLSAAASLSWAAGIFERSEAELLSELDATVRQPSPVAFLPYLSGERTPHNDATVRGQFVFLSAETSRADMVRAVLDGVAFAVADNAEALRGAGSTIRELELIGGGSRSGLWAQIIADVLGVAVVQIDGGDVGAALGAARLARMAATGAAPDEVCHKARRLAIWRPSAEAHAAYDAAWRRWQKLYSPSGHHGLVDPPERT